MFFANPWGLLGLLALPTILFIHLYQRRFPPLEVAGLHLWLGDETVKTAGQRRDRLPVTRSLLLELLAATLLSLLLAQPGWNRMAIATHLVFVLDSSASMLATPATGEPFRDRAIARMRERVAASRNPRVTLIGTGTRPMMLAGPAVEWSVAEAALVDWQPHSTRHEFHPAWDMGAQLVEQAGEQIFLTDDREIDNLPTGIELVSVGEPLSNLAFETARWSLDPDTLRGNLYLRIRNCSDSARECTLTGSSPAGEVLRRPLSLEARGSAPLSIDLPGGIQRLDLRIESPDDRLATDSQLVLLEPRLRVVKVALDLPAEHSARENLQQVLAHLSAVEVVDDSARADLLVSPLQAEGTPGTIGRWQLEIGPPLVADAGTKPHSTVGPFLVDRRSPFLEGVTLQGILWAGIQPLPAPGVPLISVGGDVLLGERVRGPDRTLTLNIDLQGSNVGASPDWPILVSNLIEACRDSRPGLRRWNYQVNERVWFDVDRRQVDLSSDAPLTLRHGTTDRSLVRAATVEIPALGETGVWQVLDGDRLLGEFAVNFHDSLESDLSTLSGGTIAREDETANPLMTTDSPQWLWMVLISAMAVAAMVNWHGLQNPESAGKKRRSRAGPGNGQPA